LKSEKLKKIKHLKKDQLVILLLFGILLVVIAIPSEPKKKDKAFGENAAEEEALSEEALSSGTEEASYEKKQEKRLKEALQRVEGVGQVEVMITLKVSSEKVVEKDTPSTSQTVEEEDSGGGKRSTRDESWSEATVYRELEDGSRTPYVVKELEPQVEGVIVIAEGGGNPLVRQNILEAVQALFPVEAHKIKIMKMEGSK